MSTQNFKQTRHRILFGVFLFSLLVLGGSVFTAKQNTDVRVRTSGENFSVMALALTELMDAHLRYATSSLEEIDRDILQEGGLNKISPFAQHQILKRLYYLDKMVANNLPFGAYFIIGPDGKMTANSHVFPASGIEIFDSEFAQMHAKEPGHELYVSQPTQSQLTGEEVIYITRRISDASDAYVGLIGVQLNISYLNDFYRKAGLGERAVIFLGKTNGQGIFRYPYSTKIASVNIAHLEAFKRILQQRNGWLISPSSPYDDTSDKDQVIGFRVSENFPIVAIATNSRANIVHAWLYSILPQSISIIVILCGLIAMTTYTLWQLRRLERVTLEAAHDGLTGLANRRALESNMIKEWSRARRTHSPISLLFLDIDYFKRFNDSLGHAEGDRCLKRVADIMRNEFRRANDIVARIGGEEIVCLLPNTQTAGAQLAAENLLQKIRNAAIIHPDSSAAKVVTASIGVATMLPSPENNDWSILLKRADKALYRAKESGRNRVAVWSPALEQEHAEAHSNFDSSAS